MERYATRAEYILMIYLNIIPTIIEKMHSATHAGCDKTVQNQTSFQMERRSIWNIIRTVTNASNTRVNKNSSL